MNTIELTPIGTIKNSISNRKEMHKIGVKSEIVIKDAFLPALLNVKENSHIIVLCFFHEAKRDALQVYPRKFGLAGPEKKGVFATRSPDRPNPISITITKVTDIIGNRIIVETLDGVDGTPVIDIKPYSIGSDLIFNTQSLNKKTNLISPSDEILIEYLNQGMNNYLYKPDSSLRLGVYSILKVIREINKMPDRTVIDFIETDYTGSALDTLYFYTKYTPGENKICWKGNADSNNTYFKLKLKSGELLEVKNLNNSDTIDLNCLELTVNENN